MPPQTQTRKITILVDTKGSKALDDIADRMGHLNRNTKSLAGNMGFLTNAFRGWLGYIGIREITRMSDEMQNLTNRLKLITGSVGGAQEALAGLSAVADRTNQSVTGVGEVYSRLALSLKGAGANTKELLSLTETLVNSFRVAGATTTETVNTIIQLSQAFSSGQLRGQELRSVMEQNATVAGLLKERYGADIYKKAEAGAISITEVLRILADNQNKINDAAKQLAPTFEQVLTKSMNKVSIAVGDINNKFELSAKFAKVMEFAIDNLGGMLITLGSIAVVLAVTQIPALIAAISTLGYAMISFSLKNPVLALLTALAVLGGVVYENWDKVSTLFNTLKANFLELGASIELGALSVKTSLDSLLGGTTSPKLVIDTINKAREMKEKASAIRESMMPVYGPQNDPMADTKKNIESLIAKIGKGAQPVQKLKEELALLNKQWKGLKITTEEYNAVLIDFEKKKIETQFKEGKYDIIGYAKALEEVRKQKLDREFAAGNLSLTKYNTAIANSKMPLLNEQLVLGKITLVEYNKELTKMEDKFRPGSAMYSGVADFIESAGTLSQGIARVTSQAFEHLSTTLTDFIKTGKLDFAAFTKAILDDITAMLVRAAIVRPIAQGIMSLGGGFLGGAGTAVAPGPEAFGGLGFDSQFARGGIMTPSGPMPLNKYANGGIANSPQVALFGEGRRPEAYVPLPDGRNIPVRMEGGSGVSVVQNITIQQDGSASANSQTSGQNAKALGDLMQRVAIDTIIKQKRPGGILNG